MDEIKKLKRINSVYKRACLFEGFYDGQKVKFSKVRLIWNSLVNIISYLVFITHLIIFLFDNESLNKELVYLRFLSSHFGARYLNFAGGIAVITLNHSLSVYKKFTENSKGYESFSFLFCYNVKEISRKYELSRSKSQRLIKKQSSFLNIVLWTHKYFYVTFGIFIFKMLYDNVMNTVFGLGFFDFYTLIAIKFVLYLLFFLSFESSVLRVFLNYYEFVLANKLLADRLDQQREEIFVLLSNRDYESSRYMNRKIFRISRNYNLILKDQMQFGEHFNKSLSFLAITSLLFTGKFFCKMIAKNILIFF